ncbi:MAG: TRAP transporter substrate-binding protein [Desulfobacterales bacterium]|nr:TRAP transporter substrate-binding protein [Desulfobacterales bacterium]
MAEEKEKGRAQVDRREFLRLSALFGFGAAIGGLACASGSADARELRHLMMAQAAKEKEKPAAEYKLIFATAGMMNRWPQGPVVTCSVELIGTMQFKEFVERESKGAISVDLIEAGSLGAQTVLAKKMQQGIIQGCSCSTQNMASLIPVWNVTDFPYAIGDEENYWKVLYSKEVNDLIRKQSMERGSILLTAFAPHRWFILKKGIPFEVRKPEQLKGLKIRVTGSRLEQKSLGILPCNATPVNWGEVYTAMQEGAIDGIHVNTAAVSDAAIHEVTGQIIDTGLMFSSDATWVGTEWYLKLPSVLKEVILEGAYQGQTFGHNIFEEFHIKQVGTRPNSPTDSIWKQVSAKQVYLTHEEKAAWIENLSVERNKNKFEPLIKQFGKKEYEAVIRAAKAPGKPEQRRWWKA